MTWWQRFGAWWRAHPWSAIFAQLGVLVGVTVLVEIYSWMAFVVGAATTAYAAKLLVTRERIGGGATRLVLAVAFTVAFAWVVERNGLDDWSLADGIAALCAGLWTLVLLLDEARDRAGRA